MSRRTDDGKGQELKVEMKGEQLPGNQIVELHKLVHKRDEPQRQKVLGNL